MKKSFKKAGAAVLSMAMLLAMGTVSMPVYADNGTPKAGDGSTNTYKPGQVNVTINAGAWADDGADSDTKQHRYDYLEGVNSADVSIYKVAELTADGWQWEDAFAGVENDDPDLSGRTGLDGTTTLDVSDFKDLLLTTTSTNGDEIPLASSTDLQSLASKLERIVKNNNLTALASDTLQKTGDTYNTVHLVADDTEYQQEVRNVIGYYLIVTETNDAGVTVQPSLVVLKNGLEDASVVDIWLKGNEVNIDKQIVSILDTDEGESTGGTVIGADNNTGIVAENDTITYQITAEVPSYDPLLDADKIRDFVIVDTPVEGLNVLDSSNNVRNFKIEVSDMNDLSPTTLDITNIPGAYTLEPLPYGYNPGSGTYDPATGDKYNGTTVGAAGVGGFRVIIHGEELRKYGPEYVAAGEGTEETPATMEGATVIITFDATVDEDLNRVAATGTAHNTYDDLVIDDLGDATLFTYPTIGDVDGNNVVNDADIAAYMTNEGITVSDADKAKIDTLDSSSSYSGNERYLRAYLALKAKNKVIDDANELAQADNGNKNTATMKFGNDYATGQGEGNDEDETKVFSVDLNLDKMVEDHLIVPQMDGTDEAVDTENNTKYEDKLDRKPVAGAVFKLTKLWGDGQEKVIGYAITTADGDMVLAEAVSGENAPVSGYAEQRFDGAGEKLTWGSVNYEGSTATKPAWIELTLGSYRLEEEFAPAGYKKWADGGITFTVTSEPDTEGNYVGVFGATTTARDSSDEDANNPKIVENKTFTFAGDDGELQNTIYNQYDDKLPATGGIGTVLFTAGGISIVLIAGALFVMYMKKRNAEDEE